MTIRYWIWGTYNSCLQQDWFFVDEFLTKQLAKDYARELILDDPDVYIKIEKVYG